MVEGIDEKSLERYLKEELGFEGPFTYHLITGGRSNVTYRIEDGAKRSFVLRRPPLKEVLATAHDVGREYRIISALYGGPVPVPRPIKYCPDPTVIGAPFYLMDFVEGYVLRDGNAVAQHLPDREARKRAGMELIGVLAELHLLDPDAVGLGDLARKEGYIERQLKRWWGQFQASCEEGDGTMEPVKEAHERLLKRIPKEQRYSIVHGDYRLDNAIVDGEGHLKAVLDWEICTLGDPLADLGLLMVYWSEPGDQSPLTALAATAQEGFPTRSELKSVYASKTGLDLSELDYYVAFGYWKLACILQGVYNRYRKGAHPGADRGWEGFLSQVKNLAEQSLELLKALN